MKKQTVSRHSSEKGVALLIAIFALLLISGVAVSLLVMSGTETAVGANYRGATQVFYAAYSGIEEARGRLRPGHPNTIDATVGINKGAGTLPLNRVYYIVNPLPGEVVDPTNLATTNPYRDAHYQTEFGIPVTSALAQPINSTAPVAVGPVALNGPVYKWVRVTAKTEFTANQDIDGNGIKDPVSLIYYDGTKQRVGPPPPGGAARQVVRATALAVLPNGSRRMVQYDISPVVLNLQLPAALTFDGQGAALFPANSNVYNVDGNDHAGCGLAPTSPAQPAIGVLTPADDAQITSSIPRGRQSNYTGSCGTTPCIEDISGALSTNLSDPQQLEDLLQTIKDNATQTLDGTTTPVTNLPDYGSQANPTITYVEGDLSLSGSVTGYGILVVTGKYSASGTVGWKGIVLVVGEGVMEVNGGGSNEYDGAVLLANTRNPDGTIRSVLGPTLLDWAGGGGNGVYYSSGCINNSTNSAKYTVLSFREITEQ